MKRVDFEIPESYKSINELYIYDIYGFIDNLFIEYKDYKVLQSPYILLEIESYWQITLDELEKVNEVDKILRDIMILSKDLLELITTKIKSYLEKGYIYKKMKTYDFDRRGFVLLTKPLRNIKKVIDEKNRF